MIECYRIECQYHDYNHCEDSVPGCYNEKCVFEPMISKIKKQSIPKGYTEEELEKDSPIQSMDA